MHKIAHNLTQVLNRIQAAAEGCGRKAQDITLLAVSKTQPAAAISEAHAAGQRAFGENYLQEALEKIAELQSLNIEWHFLGPIQSNKTRPIAEHFAWVHSLARASIAQRLNAARPAALGPLHVCIQVNADGQASKAGVALDEVAALAEQVQRLPNLRLRGLMAIPNPADPTPAFAALAALQAELNRRYSWQLDTLSMGMSDDLDLAIAAGSTLVRVGTAIFGPRH
ncbi:MAG TPA: YggS family pyridoxal phosphate-dependent enzyme [Cellvibrionaceae bacterium]|nr:YggS family pyridoxal phosphate-dependent enzyme [Cellvibrionaceae bacterium]